MSSRRSKGKGTAELVNEPFDVAELLETLNRSPKLVVLDLGASLVALQCTTRLFLH